MSSNKGREKHRIYFLVYIRSPNTIVKHTLNIIFNMNSNSKTKQKIQRTAYLTNS